MYEKISILDGREFAGHIALGTQDMSLLTERATWEYQLIRVLLNIVLWQRGNNGK